MADTIDYKLGQISSDLLSLKEMHEDEKALREENHKKINEINNRSISLEAAMLRMDSWKNGQTIYMHETTDKILKLDTKMEKTKDELSDRLRPIEIDFNERASNKKDNNSRIRDNTYKLISWLMIGLAGAVLVNIRAIFDSLLKILGK